MTLAWELPQCREAAKLLAQTQMTLDTNGTLYVAAREFREGKVLRREVDFRIVSAAAPETRRIY